MWIYNLWFTTKFLGQIWWKKYLWVMFSNAKSMTCNLEMKSITAMQNPFNWLIIIQNNIYISNDILVNCIQKGLRSNWLSDSAKNIAKNQKELRNWINSFNSSLSIPIPIPFIQFLFNSNSWNWNWNWHQFQFQFLPPSWRHAHAHFGFAHSRQPLRWLQPFLKHRYVKL